MTLPDDVHTLAGRLATFEQPHQIKRPRASSNAKKRTTTKITWPHKTPTPEALARAGFFYKPSSSSHDNVTCYICERSLDGWEPSDEPAEEHFEHSAECGWAIYAHISLRLDDPNRQEKDPSDEKMVDARTMTFRGQWPHESKKGWRCKTKKMVDAGWCYDPTPDADDAVTCFYCGLALDGWEPKDDPMEEHRRRSPGCYFFNRSNDVSTATEKASHAKKGRPSRTSKASRISSQSNATSFSEAPSFMSLGEPPIEDDSVLTIATTTSTAIKTGKKGRKTKATGRKTKNTTKVDAPDASALTSTDERVPDTLKPSMQDLPGSSPAPEPELPKAKRTRKGNAEAANQSVIEDGSVVEPHPKKGRSQRSKPAKQEQRLSDDQSQLHLELQAALEASLMSQKEDSTPRGKKRTSKGVEKVNGLHDMIVPDAAPEKMPVPPKGNKRMKGANESSIAEFDNSSLIASQYADAKVKAKQKGQKGKKAAKEPLESSLTDTSQNSEGSTVIRHNIMPDSIMSDAEAVEPEPATAKAEAAEPEFILPDAEVVEPEVVLTDAEASEQEQHQVVQDPPWQATSPAPRQLTASVSPQSSDAENHPPSSNVKSMHQPTSVLSPTKALTQTIRVPLAMATPAASPSKRNVINGRLASAFPWEAADLETVFLGSPDKENMTLTDVLRTASAELTSPEKKMSVEEWIKSNASKGEDKLRRDCERLVGIFETQGVKALKSLEGIECI